MTAPVLAQKKFWIVKPKAAINQIKNPAFAGPDYEEDWTASGAGVTIAETGDYARRGAYSMKVTPATGIASGAYYGGLSVTDKLAYTFSCDVKGVAGQAMRVYIASATPTVKATTTFVATGYWQRVEVTHTAAENAATYRAYVVRDAVASTDPYYVDGAQFEQASSASTFIEGNAPGCRWMGAPRNSYSARTGTTGLGGELIDLSDYCEIVSVSGLGHGDWNQILTKMTSGGDMYQTHTRKSRQFSIVVDFVDDTLGGIETKRKTIIDAIRPDYLFGEADERRIIRYQGFSATGEEATQPIDIICVPLPATLTDTPDIPSHQRAILNFTIPSGLMQGAYNESAALSFKAEFPAEFIVKRDPDGNWCKWNGAGYDNLLKGQGTVQGLNGIIYCMAEGPDHKIYVGGAFTNAGGVTTADYLARWNPVSEAWESVIAGVTGSVTAMAFDANGDLYIGGTFTNLGDTNGDYIVKITNAAGVAGTANPAFVSLGTGLQPHQMYTTSVNNIVINPNGTVYVGGIFATAGGVAGTENIARWVTNKWYALGTGLNSYVYAMALSPANILYIGGAFTNAEYPYLCKWTGSALAVVGTNTDINGVVRALDFTPMGLLYVGGDFTNAGGIPAADKIAKWNGASWSALGTGANNSVYNITVGTSGVGIPEATGNAYVSGNFTAVGSLTLADRAAIWRNGAWQRFDIDLPGSGIVYAVLPALDGSLYVAGNFSTTASSANATCAILSDKLYEITAVSASANTYPVMNITGPGTIKSITNHSSGKQVIFNSLTLNAYESIKLSFDPLNLQFTGSWKSRGNVLRYVAAGSDYGDFYLSPGRNRLALYMTGTDAGSGATIEWTPLFWGLDGAVLE